MLSVRNHKYLDSWHRQMEMWGENGRRTILFPIPSNYKLPC